MLLLQLYDLHNCIGEKHLAMRTNEHFASILDDEALSGIMSSNTYLVPDEYKDNGRPLAVAAMKNGMKIYFSTANSGTYSRTYEEAAKITASLRERGDIRGYVVATGDPFIRDLYLARGDTMCHEYNGSYYICAKGSGGS